MLIAGLVGNPNVGKTTLFNALTGSNQYVGNWAGVTVEKKEGFLQNDIKIVDLPGIYALDTFSNEEKISKSFLENDDVDVIINIVDASNLNRNLYLTTQLKQFKKPIILVLNMIDAADSKGYTIDYKALSENLNVTVVPIVASKNKGIEDIKALLIKGDFLSSIDGNDYHFPSEKAAYDYIDKIINNSLVKSSDKKSDNTGKVDSIFLNPWLAYPIFLAILFIIFEITFSWIGQPLADLLDAFLNDSLMPWVSELLSSASPWFSSLIVDGIIGGVGSILVFFPIIITLFLCITILEDSGYMARVAFIMDKLMRKMGLSGKAFIPMIIGFGCSVPGIMAARTLESEKDRKLTALLVPLMSCNARLPVYALFASIFFPNKSALVVGSLYLLGIIMAFFMGILFKNTLFKKDEEPFIIELPEYKLPSFTNVIKHTWEKGKGFIKKAGTVIFAISVIIWFASNFNFSGYTDINNSLLASIGRFIAPIFAPLGFGDWQSSVSILTGIMAKEAVIGTMGVIYGSNLEAVLPQYFTVLSAYAFMIFVLLYTPCVAVIGAMKKEYGTKMTLFSVGYQFLLAWIAAFLFYNIGSLIL
ncbi:ferrous iron transport protein B [Clostridium polynesiense]|uniref:ferrous iron transport protein B n=1 Tax=Clostridium polynesiense TaxID=1325933 RepID=UPI00058BC352|nr:ferrous iron transport protein B [Clostridium polynesiense]